MRKYVTNTKDTCWPDCIASILEINPGRVPNFVKLYKNKYLEATREWLKKNFKKGIVYIPARCFMETGEIRNNCGVGPAGYSIAHLSMVDNRSMHVVIAFNGEIIYDNGDDRWEEYGTVQGYYIIYDLEYKRKSNNSNKNNKIRKRGVGN